MRELLVYSQSSIVMPPAGKQFMLSSPMKKAAEQQPFLNSERMFCMKSLAF